MSMQKQKANRTSTNATVAATLYVVQNKEMLQKLTRAKASRNVINKVRQTDAGFIGDGIVLKIFESQKMQFKKSEARPLKAVKVKELHGSRAVRVSMRASIAVAEQVKALGEVLNELAGKQVVDIETINEAISVYAAVRGGKTMSNKQLTLFAETVGSDPQDNCNKSDTTQTNNAN